MADTPITRATAVLATLHQEKSRLDIEHKVRVAPLASQIASLEEKLLAWFQGQGSDASVVSGMQFKKTTREVYNCKDRSAFWAWINQSSTGFTYYQSNIIQKEVKDYLEKHKVMPPGIEKQSVYKYTVNLKK